MKKSLFYIFVLMVVLSCSSCSNKSDSDDSKDNISLSEDAKNNDKIEYTEIVLSNDVTIIMNKIEKGTFKMGSYEEVGEEDELPVRDITISKSFYIGKYEITQKQWEAVMGENPSTYKGENLPVESVNFDECIEFCKKLSDISGKNISLPTEAQWEYACRAKTETKWFFGNNDSDYGIYANSNMDDKTVEVGNFKPNQNGLYDMYGNVMEWCLDYYGDKYPEKDLTDPTGCTTGETKVSRGGGWGAAPDSCRSGYRNACGADTKSDGIGLRIVVN